MPADNTPANTADENARREYWTQLLDQAADFMDAIRNTPVSECNQPVVYMPDAAKNAGIEITFSTIPYPIDAERMFYIREGIIGDLLSVAEAMNRRGWVLHIEDAYRSVQVQRELGCQDYTFDVILHRVMWELRGELPTPEFMARRAAGLIADSPKVGTHMSASAVDISVFRKADGSEVSRGFPYLEMTASTPMQSPFVDADARRNRDEITDMFAQFGFVTYPYEFWHYNKHDAYHAHLTDGEIPARYGAVDADLATGLVTPIANPTDLLVSLDETTQMIGTALAKLRTRK